MERTAILLEIEALKDKLFLNQMEDHWNEENRQIEREGRRRLRELEEMLGGSGDRTV